MAVDRDDDAPSADEAWSGFRRHLAFIVGIDDYRHVSKLETAVSDATRLAEVLREDHDFEVHTLLLDATGAQLRELLQRTLKNTVGPKDRVLFYFAGHGVAVDGADGPAGYLVPADAEKNDTTTYIPMSALQVALDALPCSHLMLVLDCCFSGAFKWTTSERPMTGLVPKRIYTERFARFIADPARQIITSAAYDQKALDVLNGQATGERGAKLASDGRRHSPFALALFDALAGEADVKTGQRGDGAITATEIYLYIRDHIEPATIQAGANLRQTPSFFPLRGHDKGEFMFRNRNHPFNMDAMPDKSPFKGLASFEEGDAHLFYGRDRVVADLARRADDKTQRLLVVSGPSGTGKSSVIKAGLLPVLKEQGLGVELTRPGEHPMAELAQVEERIAQGTGRVVLIIDQYEELITRCANIDGERRRFDERLKALLGDDDRIERIVITVRSDFEPLLNGWALKADWAAGRCTVPPFNVDELRQVIVLPAMQEVMVFEPPALVDQIIDEVVQSPGALPLLSYTLSEMFQAYQRRGDKMKKRELTLADYDAIGGVLGALRTKANGLHEEIRTWDNDHLLRKIMLRMVSVEGELAGRNVPKDEFEYVGVDESWVEKVLGALDTARLVVGDKGGYEPAHDALVRTWDTLREWIHQAGRDNLALGEKLRLATREYIALDKNPSLLWNDNPNLDKVRKLVDDRQACWFNRAEIEFVEASVRLKARKLRIAIGTTAAVFAIVTALMVWGWVERGYATSAIAASGDFSDHMLTDMMGQLRVVERTQEARTLLVTQVRQLHATLTTKGGAVRDQNTDFWTLLLEGEAYLDNEQYSEAKEKFLASTELAEDHLRRQSDNATWLRNLSIAYGQLGDLAKKRSDFNEARRHYLRALEIDQSLASRPGSDRVALRDEFVSHFRLAALERSHKDADPFKLGEPFLSERRQETHRHFEAAHRLADRLRTEHKNDAEAKRNHAMALVELGNATMDLAASETDDTALRALGEFKQAIDWAEQWPEEVLRHTESRPYLELAYAQYGFLLRHNNQRAEAREALHDSLKLSFCSHGSAKSAPLPPTKEQQVLGYTNYMALGAIEVADRSFEAAHAAFDAALRIANTERSAGRDVADWQERANAATRELRERKITASGIRSGRKTLDCTQVEPASQVKPTVAACVNTPQATCAKPG